MTHTLTETPTETPTGTPDDTATLLHVPLAEIDPGALDRDRTGLVQEQMDELQASIAASGVRMPVELYRLAEPRPPVQYGLISGYRRFCVVRDLHAQTGQDRYATIPALVRTPASTAEALAAMIEENEIRAELSPWEKGHAAMQAVRHEVFANIEEAVEKLFPAADKYKRRRIRQLARLAEDLDGWLTTPEKMSQQMALRVADACRKGFTHVFRAALEESSIQDHDHQMALIQPILREAEDLPKGETIREPRWGEPTPRPRRVAKVRHTLTVRRERTRDGWCLHFTGRDAHSDLMDHVFEAVDRLFAPVD